MAPLSEVVGEGEVEIEDIEDKDDIEPLKMAKNPRLPTTSEV